MSKGIFTAVSGAMAQTAKLDTIANNLANVNTPGFKRDSQIFKEYLTSYEKEPGTITVPRVPVSVESFYAMDGADKSYVDVAGTHTDFSQGGMKQTGNKLDVAIEGDGLFEVLTASGVRYTRAGSFTIDSENRLVTKQGYPVLRDGGAGGDPSARVIKVNGNNLHVSDNGEIFEGEQNVGRFSVMGFANKDALQKTGQGLFMLRPGIEPQMAAAQEAKLHQGFIEGSNVNIVKEMTDMISATRVFESTQKAIKAYDEMAAKVATEVPKLNTGG